MIDHIETIKTEYYESREKYLKQWKKALLEQKPHDIQSFNDLLTELSEYLKSSCYVNLLLCLTDDDDDNDNDNGKKIPCLRISGRCYSDIGNRYYDEGDKSEALLEITEVLSSWVGVSIKIDSNYREDIDYCNKFPFLLNIE